MGIYLPAGLMAAQKKMGYNGNQETNEKVTDFARGQFEKASGYVMSSYLLLRCNGLEWKLIVHYSKKVPDKFSN